MQIRSADRRGGDTRQNFSGRFDTRRLYRVDGDFTQTLNHNCFHNVLLGIWSVVVSFSFCFVFECDAILPGVPKSHRVEWIAPQATMEMRSTTVRSGLEESRLPPSQSQIRG